jgi:predicted esterase
VSDLGFVHVYRAGSNGSRRTLLLLHGTGGDEQDLLPMAPMLDAAAGALSPRGKVLAQGLPRFFKRLSEGVFDAEDVKRRARELAGFVAHASTEYGFAADQIIAVGFSNGANIASALLLLAPQTLSGAILFRGMVPIVPDEMPALPRTLACLSNGRHDPLVAIEETERLTALLKAAGAQVTLAWQPASHQLTPADIAQAKDWLAVLQAGTSDYLRRRP